ncbi:MAG: hypothetical protein ACQEXJ_13910 [Myxococcota bacterium]
MRVRSKWSWNRLPVLVAGLALAAAITGCDPSQEGDAGTLLPPLSLEAVGPSPVVPGTRLALVGGGFVPAEVAEVVVIFEGAVGDRPVEFAVHPEREGEDVLVVPVTGQVADALVRADGVFRGDVVVRRHPADEGSPTHEASLAVELPVAEELTPTVTGLEPTELHPGDRLVLSGDGFLHPGEGVSLVAFDGVFTTTVPPSSQPVEGLVVPGEPGDSMSRDRLELTLTPDLFGIRPGTFEGNVRVVNSAADGAESASEALAPGPLVLHRPEVDEVTPTSASRGQLVEVHGRGLLPADGRLQAGTLLVLEGTFEPARGPTESWTGVDAQALFPDMQPNNAVAAVVLRVDQDEDGDLVGLGRRAGVFEGTVSPLLFFGPDAVTGHGLPLTFTVEPPRQVVHLRFLPTFDDALAEFGLLAEREAVIRRILEVTARDYAGINIAFTVEPPADFVEYAIVEIGGHDPNGTGLFGLDNTAGKDVGNLRFDDVIGGFNAETRARGFAAFGGVFVAEMLNLSSTLSDTELASPRFDDIFAPVSPVLGGVMADEGESDGDGGRARVIREAVRVLGNLVGGTVSHEVGHSLGLTAIQGQFHNTGDNPGWIMDAGVFRPFEERAEIDGRGPAVFSPFNRTYLESILPTGS